MADSNWLILTLGTSGPAAAAVLFSQPVSDRTSSPDRKCRYFLKLLPGDPEHTGLGSHSGGGLLVCDDGDATQIF